MEVEKEVRVLKIDFECPKCEAGFLRPTGAALMSNPPIYPHKCNSCEYVQSFKHSYPIIRYE